MEPIDTTAMIPIPERLTLRVRLAGPGRRALAWSIDGVVRALILSVFVTSVLIFSGVPGVADLGVGVILVVLFALEWAYGAFFETMMAGRTPGKWIVGLRVVVDDGSPAAWPALVVRNLLRAVDWLPGGFALALVCMVSDARLRRVGDLVAGTMVVCEDRERSPAALEIRPPMGDHERQALPARVPLAPGAMRAIEGLFRRQDRLSTERVEELAGLLAPGLAARFGVRGATWTRTLQLAWLRAAGRDT